MIGVAPARTLGVAFVVFVLGALLVSCDSTGVSKKWPQEPGSFLGLKFGQSVESQIPRCQGNPDYEKPKVGSGYCYFVGNVPAFGGGDYLLVDGIPDIGIDIWNIFPYVIEEPRSDGSGRLLRFEGMRFNFRSRDYGKLRDLFVAKYGNPTRTNNSQINHVLYVTPLPTQKVKWEGENVIIDIEQHHVDAEGYIPNVHEGRVLVITKAARAYARARSDQEQKAQKHKDNL
jgi:hypothetical protein